MPNFVFQRTPLHSAAEHERYTAAELLMGIRLMP